MKKRIRLVVLAALAAGCASVPPTTPEVRRAQAQAAIGNWSEASRLSAAALLAEYGPPDKIEASRLVWDYKGPWKRTAVWDSASYRGSDGSGDDIEQTVSLAVRDAEREQLQRGFNDKTTVSGLAGEVSVRGASEGLNFLTMNLAYEIVRDGVDPLEARKAYQRMVEIAAAGKSSMYMHGLLFTPDNEK